MLQNASMSPLWRPEILLDFRAWACCEPALRCAALVYCSNYVGLMTDEFMIHGVCTCTLRPTAQNTQSESVYQPTSKDFWCKPSSAASAGTTQMSIAIADAADTSAAIWHCVAAVAVDMASRTQCSTAEQECPCLYVPGADSSTRRVSSFMSFMLSV